MARGCRSNVAAVRTVPRKIPSSTAESCPPSRLPCVSLDSRWNAWPSRGWRRLRRRRRARRSLTARASGNEVQMDPMVLLGFARTRPQCLKRRAESVQSVQMSFCACPTFGRTCDSPVAKSVGRVSHDRVVAPCPIAHARRRLQADGTKQSRFNVDAKLEGRGGPVTSPSPLSQ